MLALLSGWFAIVSVKEKERRAALVAALLCLTLLVLVLLWHFSLFIGKDILAIVLTAFFGLSFTLLVIPIRSTDQLPRYRTNRIDERDIPFSRSAMTPEQQVVYYKRHPEKKEIDDRFRKLPGIISEENRRIHPRIYATTDDSMRAIEALRFNVDGPVKEPQNKLPPATLQQNLLEHAQQLGALDVGVCELKPEHFYHTRGRHHYYGDKVESTHKYAMVFAVEMDRSYIATAPQAPVLMESYKQYLRAGTIAVQAAEFLRNMGWEAKAHIDSNYEVICSLVARDAGLGEIGRMGIMMSTKTGPRCRLSVVTTNAPLEPVPAKIDSNILYFCEICKKCVDCCPTQSISDKPYNHTPEAVGWKINSDKCYSYWMKVGTDCARCMAVCPFSHDDSFLHKVVRRGISNSKLFARFALWMDDIFYGKRPKSKAIPGWMERAA